MDTTNVVAERLADLYARGQSGDLRALDEAVELATERPDVVDRAFDLLRTADAARVAAFRRDRAEQQRGAAPVYGADGERPNASA